MRNKQKKANGSSLVTVLIIMSILMIASTAMVSYTYSAYKYRSLQENKKISLYASEAGINEAYEIIFNFVNEALKQGNKAVEAYNKDLDEILKKEKLELQYGDENKKLKYFTKNGIDEEKIEKERKLVFKEGYRIGIDDYYNENGQLKEEGYNSYIKKDDELKNRIANHDYSAKLKEKDKINLSVNIESKNDSTPVVVTLTSLYSHNDIQKELRVTYEINEAEYNVDYDFINKLVKLPKGIWSKALVVNGDMELDGAKVSVNNSDIYVKGSDDKRLGIQLIGWQPSLNVKGNVITSENLQYSYLGDNQGKVEVQGNVYAKNLIVNKGSKETDTKIKGNLYVLDDMELNEEKATVNIDGAFYGVSDGSQAKNNEPDNSSSVVINTNDFNKGGQSTLNIGQELYIAGTSYISLDGFKYQTGESMSIKGNYKAYMSPLEKTTNEKLKSEKVIFEYLKPLTLAYKYKSDENKSEDLLVKDKIDYFQEYYKEKNDIKIGDNININEKNSNNIYLGSIFKPKSKEKIDAYNWKVEDIDKIKEKRVELKEKIYYMGLSSFFENAKGDNIDTKNDPVIKIQDYMVNFDNVKNEIHEVRNNVINIRNGYEKNTYYLIGKDSKETSIALSNNENIIKIDLNNGKEKYNGVIITKGNLIISGKLDFTGMIICGGNLIFKDSQEKIINYDVEYLDSYIAQNGEEFSKIFIPNDSDDSSKFLFVNLYESNHISGSASASEKNIQLIKRKRWEMLK